MTITYLAGRGATKAAELDSPATVRAVHRRSSNEIIGERTSTVDRAGVSYGPAGVDCPAGADCPAVESLRSSWDEPLSIVT
jgi:hypothetical protein